MTAEWFLETCETEQKYLEDRERLLRILIVEALPFFDKSFADAQIIAPFVLMQRVRA